MRRALLVGAVANSGLACKPVDPPALEECGNGIVEPSAGEDCEPSADAPGCGSIGAGATACRFICTEADCPDGFRCGVDAICRQPCLGYEGEPQCEAFEPLSTDLTTASVAQISLANVHGDPRPEVIAVEYTAEDPVDAGLRTFAIDGDETVAGPSVAVGEFPRLGRVESGGALYWLAQREVLAAAPAAATERERQALVFALEPELGFTEVLMQGPQTVDEGPLRLASFTRPPDVPPEDAASLLFAFRDGAIWHDEGSPVQLPSSGDPVQLVGPAVGQPIDTEAAAAAERWASATCDVLVYGYRGTRELFARNLCDGVAGTWTSVPLQIPNFPNGVGLGDGLVLADADGDGLDDLVFTSDANRIHVAYSKGDGTFNSSPDSQPAAAGDGRFDGGVGPGARYPLPPDASLGVIAVGDFNDDDRPDFITRSTWVRSCGLPDCGTCDVEGYRCDVGQAAAPGYRATAASIVDYDGDGDTQLAVLALPATEANDTWFPPQQWGPVRPAAGDLMIIDRPGRDDWSARVIPLAAEVELRTSGDLDGDGADELVLHRIDEAGDALWVVFGGSDARVERSDFARIVDLHVQSAERTLAVVSEDLDGTRRRLTRLSADHEQRLLSTTKLELEVVPRSFVPGRFGAEPDNERALAVIGESPDGDTEVELLLRGGSTFFDASSRHHARTALDLDPRYAASTRAIAVDLDLDGVEELVVFGADAVVRTLATAGDPTAPSFELRQRVGPLPESYVGPRWPGDGAPASLPQRRDLDDDGDLDVWMLTAEDPPRLAAFENLGDGRLDVEGRTLSAPPTPVLSVCEDDDCTVHVRAFAAFSGPTDRSESVSPTAVDVLLVSRRALFLWTVDPFDPSTADALDLVELAVIRGGRLPLSPPGGQVLGAIGDIDGDGVDDVVAGGRNGIRWLNGLAVIP